MEKKQRNPKRSFTDEFKKEAIELANKIGNIKAAKELGIQESSIRQWKKKFEEGRFSNSNKKSYSELEKENRRLLKENGYLKEIAKVLKKSTAIFSADHVDGLK